MSLPDSSCVNRRAFLKNTAIAGIGIAAPAVVRGRNLNSKLQLASVGTEGRGWADTFAMSSHSKVEFAGFCDIDLNRTARVKKLRPDAPIFQD